MIKLKNSDKVVKRLALALKKGEKMGIWSDYDPDGVFALVLAYEALKNAGFKKENLKLILPNQQKYGRSFNKFHLGFLRKQKIKLILGIDFGTSDFEQVSMARKMGFEIILLDHHRQMSGELPALLINPWQKGENSKCKSWSGTGVAYLFFENLYKKLKINQEKLLKSLDLLLIPVITDYVKIEGCNLPYIKESLNRIKNLSRPGLKASLKIMGLTNNLSLKNFVKNRESIDDFYGLLEGNHDKNNVFKLLICADPKKAENISELIKKHLGNFNNYVNKIFKKGIAEFNSARGKKKPKFIFWGINEKIKLAGATGKITGKLNNCLKIPVYFYSDYKNIIKGNARANFTNDNVLEAMKSCSDLFIAFGGHPKAGGFYIKKKNLPKLQKALEKHYESK